MILVSLNALILGFALFFFGAKKCVGTPLEGQVKHDAKQEEVQEAAAKKNPDKEFF